MAFKGVSGNAGEIVSQKWSGFGRRFLYRPATLWLGWVFVAAVAAFSFFFILMYRIWDTLRPSQEYLFALSPYALAVLIPLTFFIAYAGLQYTVARGFFGVLGDASIYHLNQQTPLGVIVTKDEFDTFSDPELSKDVTYMGKTVVRHKVNLWGRLGGVRNWPGWDGGKRDGYYNVVYDFWDEIDGQVLHVTKSCPTCEGKGRIERGHYYPPMELEMLSRVVPGQRLGTTVVFPYEAWPLEFDEVPEGLALAIRSDPEWRVISRIWNMEDPLPSRGGAMGSATPSNTLVRLWSTERMNRFLRDRVVDLSMQMAMIRGMGEEALGGGPGGFGPGGFGPGTSGTRP